MHPGADRRKKAIEPIAAGVKLKLSAVVDVVGPHRADDGQIVDATADVRPPIADLDAALAAFAEADLHRVQLGENLSLVGSSRADVLVEEFLVQDAVKRRLGDRFAGVFVECRLRDRSFPDGSRRRS